MEQKDGIHCHLGKKVGLLHVRDRYEVDGKTRYFTRVVRVTERTIDKKGQALLFPTVELEGW